MHCEACESLKWKLPTKIQRETIPVALQGNYEFEEWIGPGSRNVTN